MKIKDLFLDERPRERLLENGAGSLSDVELLAVLLRTGNQQQNAMELARSLLESSDGKIEDLGSKSIENLLQLNGIGPAKAATLAACFELGKRSAVRKVDTKHKSITSPANVYRLMAPDMRALDHEECWVLYLNRVNHLICKEMMSSGGMDSTVIDSKAIIRRALEKKASGVILVHNHPSGSPLPGVADIEQTRNLKRALSTCDISLIDHLIVAKGSYYSFADEEVRM
jgi:DNA repair protein RadC